MTIQFTTIASAARAAFSCQEKPREEGEVIITVSQTEVKEAELVAEQLKKHPTGYLLVIFKSSHLLYLARDGKVIEGEKVKKSDLDGKFYGQFKGKPEDEITISFPIPIALSENIGPRDYRYDKKTPEGEYFVCALNDREDTKYTVALEISYPNAEDAKKALEKGHITRAEYQKIVAAEQNGVCPPPDTYLGGYIKIHGPTDTTIREWGKGKNKVCSSILPSYCQPMTLDEYLAYETPDNGFVTQSDWTWGCIATEVSAIFYLRKTVPIKTPVIIYP